ncbi:COG3014 family protein [Aeromonas mytilicola subsp. aquatica]|uniref:COG3014 family protein n=1 Tax=Aeromonas mytilicola TaxID=3377113 RepID=UPI0037C0A992
MRPASLTGLLLAGLLLGGCASRWQDLFVSYSDQMVPLRNQLLLGHAAEALPKVRESTPGDDTYVLDQLEKGRIAWLAGQDAISKQGFAAADSRLAWEDNQARYRLSQGLAQAGSLLTNDQTMAYRTPDYERTMLHHYLALNYLQRGDAEGALVEVRRANQVQERALKARADEVRKAKEESEESEAEGEMRQLMSRGAPELDRLIGQVKNGFQNAYTFYFSGVLYEAAGDLNDAWVDYQRGYQIAPDNQSLQDALLRLARLRGSADELKETEKKVDRKAPPLAKDQGQLVVLFEDGLIPARREIFLPLPISTSSGDFRTFTVAVPYYDNRASDTGPLTVSVGKQAGRTSSLVRLESLAAKDLQERLPGMLTRQALRLVAKEQLRRSAAKEGGDVGNILVGIFNTLSERADTRSWLTLPAEASSWQGMVPAGEVQLQLGAGSAMRTLPLTVHAGRTTLVWVQRLGAGLSSRVMPL